MNKIAKRLLTVILAAACVITALPDTAYEVYAEEIDIIADDVMTDDVMTEDVMTEDVVTEEDILIEEEVSVEEETDASEVAETEAEPEIAAPVEEEIQSEGESVEYCSGEDEAGIEEVIDEKDMELAEDPVKYHVSANIEGYVDYIGVTSGGTGPSLFECVVESTESTAFTFYVTPCFGYTVDEVSYKVGSNAPVTLNYTEYNGPDSYELYEYKYVIPEGKITADTVISVSTKWIICTVTAVGSNFTADSKANPTLAPGKTFSKNAEYLEEYIFYIKPKSGYKLNTAGVKCYYKSDVEYTTEVGSLELVDYSETDGYKYRMYIPGDAFTCENLIVKVPVFKEIDLSKCTIKAYFDGSPTANSAKYTDTVKESGAVANKIEIYNGRTLVDNLQEGTDYTVSYENNKVSGTAYIILTAKDDSCFCSGSCKQAFSIVAPKINDKNAVSITYSTSVSWNGEETKLDDLVIKDITNPDLPVTLTEGTDYVLAYSNNTKPGKATITIVGINGYDGNTTVNYTINKLNLADALPVKEDIEVGESAIIIPNITDTTYNGKQYKPEEGQIIFWNKYAEGSYTIKTYLKKGTDYTVSYGKNVNAGTGTLTITGKGNYTGKITREFTIRKMNFEDSYADLSIDISMADSFAYKKGKEVKPVPTVVLKQEGAKDIKLKANKDFTVTYPDADYIETGLKHLTIEGIGNFEGIKNESFYIAGKNIADKKLVTIDTTSATAKEILKKTYAGKEVQLASYECEQIIKSATTGDPLEWNTDYIVTYSNNDKAGTAKVIISGIGQYYGTKTINMTISKVNVDQAYRDNMKITLDGTEITSESSYAVPYTGYAHKPRVKIYDYNVTPYHHILEEGVDYTVSYANNVNAGTTKKPYATATISFKGNYAATKEVKNIPVQFGIDHWCLNDSCELNQCKIDIEKKPVFLGGKKEVKPGVTLKICDGNGGRDRWLTVNPSAYKVTYPKNVTKSIGEVTATIVPAKGLNDTNIIPRTKEEIVKGKTTTVIDPQECTYTIVKANIENVTVSTIKAQTFKGEAVTPKVTVKYNGVTLKEGTDYIVSYRNNKARGIGKVIIEPIVNSNYCGTNKIVEFVIK